MKHYYEQKVAVVTGGASGIGLALCEALLDCGAQRVVLADVNAAKLSAESARLEAAHPGKVRGIQTDVTQQDRVAAMIRQAAEFGGGHIHFLFNNAGLGLYKAFDDVTDADWECAFKVNFFSAVYGIRAVLPVMRAQGGGHIANTSSGIAYSNMAYQSMYSATKSALLALTGSLRYELWDEHIRLSTVIPGTVATPIWEKSGGAPAGAITPAQSARAILKGVSANERIIMVTPEDREGALNSVRPEVSEAVDAYMVNVARQRKRGKLAI